MIARLPDGLRERRSTFVSARRSGDVAPQDGASRPVVPLMPAAAVAVGAGVLLDTAFPGAGSWPTAPLAIAFLVLAFYGRGIGMGAILGFGFGLGFFIPHVAWSGTYVGALPWLALATFEALYLAVFGVAAVFALRCTTRAAVQVPLIACVWVAQEALRSRVPFGGFPWGRLAFSQADAPAVGLAALGGAPAVSFAVAVSGATLAVGAIRLLARWPAQGARWHIIAGATTVVIAAMPMAIGAVVPRPVDGDSSVTVAAVQGNVPRAGLDFNAERRAILDNHANATLDLAADVATGERPRPDLVVWPENASDIDPLRNGDAAAVISNAVDAVGVPTLVGAVLQEPADKLSNTSIVWQPGEGPGERYVKQRPVPFAEYVPFRSFFRAITDTVDLVPRDFVAGQGSNVVTIGPATAGIAICFEVAIDGLLRDAADGGADLLLVQTNNATFGYTDESVQQLAMSRLRAVEHGRSVVHISNVGVSALIRPDGSMVQTSGHFTQETLLAELPLREALTLATRLGAWPEIGVVAVSVIGVGIGALRGRRPRRETESS